MGNASIEERRKVAARLREGSGHGLLGLYSAVLGEGEKNRTYALYSKLADLIDPGEDVGVDAYDLLPEEDREALRWIREDEVDLEHVQAKCYLSDETAKIVTGLASGRSTPADIIDALRKRLMPLGFEWTDAFAGAVDFMDCIHDLLYTIDGGEHTSKEMFAEIMKRLMPKGIEWPTVDGKPVDFVTEYEPSLGVLEAVSIYSNGACEVMGHDGIIKDVKEIHVATPKVLDADGVEVEVGDDLYSVEGMLKFHVSAIDRKSGRIATEAMFALDKWADPKIYTHRAPVLAADGEPLREGETVWRVSGGDSETVAYTISADASHPAQVVLKGREDDWPMDAKYLTHERPESKCRDCAHWQKDPTADKMGVCWFFYHEYEGEDCYAARRADIGACEEFMPRAKALAGKEG